MASFGSGSAFDGLDAVESKFATGTIFGLRSWKIGYPDKLYPHNWYGQIDRWPAWKKGTNVSACQLEYARGGSCETRKPSKVCSCGFYAYFLESEKDTYKTAGTISGVIEAWGAMVVGDEGFRAEKAMIRALYLPHDDRVYSDCCNRCIVFEQGLKKMVLPYIQPTIEHYDVPVFETEEDMLAEFPVTKSNPFKESSI